MDLFLAYAYRDEAYASGLEDDPAGRGPVVAEPRALRPGQRILRLVARRLHESRAAIVIVAKAFLAFSWSRKELDGITTRDRVTAILSDVGEPDVARHSPRLAVAAFPGSLSERLVHLLRPEEETG